MLPIPTQGGPGPLVRPNSESEHPGRATAAAEPKGGVMLSSRQAGRDTQAVMTMKAEKGATVGAEGGNWALCGA